MVREAPATKASHTWRPGSPGTSQGLWGPSPVPRPLHCSRPPSTKDRSQVCRAQASLSPHRACMFSPILSPEMAQVADGKEAHGQAGGLHKDTATSKHPGAQGGGLSLWGPQGSTTHTPALCLADPAQGCPENTSHPEGRQPARAARGQLSGHQAAVRPEKPAPSLQFPQQACPLGESRAQHQKAPSRPGRGGGSVSTLSCIISFLMVRVCMVYLSLFKKIPSIRVLILKLCCLVTAYGGVMIFLSSLMSSVFSVECLVHLRVM